MSVAWCQIPASVSNMKHRGVGKERRKMMEEGREEETFKCSVPEGGLSHYFL